MSAYYENPTEPQEREALIEKLLTEAPEKSLYRKLANMRTFVQEQNDRSTHKKVLSIIEELTLQYHAKQISSEQEAFIMGAHLSELYALWSSMDDDLVSQVGRLEQITKNPEFPFL